MAAKAQIVDFLGDKALVLPAMLDAAVAANDRAKYVLSLLQMAASHAENPEGAAPSLKSDREACGIEDASLDRSVSESDGDGQGTFHIPGTRKLLAILDEALAAMLAPVRLVADESEDAAALHKRFQDRLERLIQARPEAADDIITGAAISAMTSGRPASGDGFHVLVMDLHKEINRLQGTIATEEVEGAKAYGITEADRPLIAAFMRGVTRTAPLKFDHPGLATAAARSGEALLIQNDIGTTDAHVLVVRVTGLALSLTHTDVHLQRLRFFQSVLEAAGMRWEDLHSHQGTALAKGDLFYVAHGVYEAKDAAELAAFVERLGSRIVFLIDWNRARKRLGLLVPNETAVEILRWATDQDIGHRGFLALGGERLVYEALEQAVKTPLRYGEPLHEMIGTEVAKDYLCYVLQTASQGLLRGQSATLIRDQVRAELFNHFHSAEQRLLDEAGRHASFTVQLAAGLRAGLRKGVKGGRDALAQNAAQAKLLESRADDIVKETRLMVRRVPGQIFRQILEIADDAADDIEDAAFLAGLLAGVEAELDLPAPLLGLADLALEGAQAFQRAIGAAQYVHRGGAREKMQLFLEAIDHVVNIEHQTDERERAVTVVLVGGDIDARHLHLVSGIASHLESAADAMLRASLTLRDHVLGEVMFA